MKISVDAVSHQANSKYFNLPVDPKAHTADMKKCLYKQSQFFLQYSCEQDTAT